MRRMPTAYLKPGMKVGKNLYDKYPALLISKGHVLTQQEITRITNLKYQAVYIADEYDDTREGEDTIEDISDTLRNTAVTAIKDLFLLIDTGKPVHKSVVKNVNHVVSDIVDEIVSNGHATYTLTDLKLFDDYTYYHSVNVTVIAIVLGVALGLGKTALNRLGLGALMHDIGKMFVPKEILFKTGRLTPEEFSVIKAHSKNGYEYMKQISDFPTESNLAILTHHEKYDGNGYPYGVKENKIPLFGRILTVADVFDALISDRPYRKALPASEAIEYIIGGSGDLFDPNIVTIFKEKISPYPVGTYVRLSNGLKGMVVENKPEFGLRPKVKILTDTANPVYYDLSRGFFDITVTDIIYL